MSVAAFRAALSFGAAFTAQLTIPAATYAQAAQQTYQFSIVAQPLAGALVRFSSTTGIDVLFNGTLPTSNPSPGYSGSATAESALTRLLDGSGLSWRMKDARTVVLVDPRSTGSSISDDGATRLAPITVTGDAMAVDGVVAKGSRTATKTDIPLIEIPQTVNVVSRREIEQRGANDLNAAIAYTPGVRAVDYPGGQGVPDIYLRGFRDVSQFSNYRDGLRNGFNSYDGNIEIYGLERLDILKGPSSVLFGQSTPGGLINATSKRPTQEPLHEIEAQYGSFDRKQVGVDFSGAATQDGTFLYRLTGLYRDSDTQIDHSPDDAIYIAPAFTWTPDDATSFTFLGSFQRTEKGGAEQSLPMANTIFDDGVKIPSDLYLGIPGLTRWNTENTSAGYEFKHEFDGGWTFSQNLRYTYSDIDYTAGFIWDWPTTLVDGHFANIMAQKRPKTSNTFLVDNNLNGTFETGSLQHEVLLGVDYGYYSSQETRANSDGFIRVDILDPHYDASGLTFAAPWSDEDLRQSQVGIYAQDQIEWENWVFSLGGRYDWVKNRLTDNLASSTTSRRDGAFTGRAGAAYLFDNGVAPYLSYATSFQPDAGTDFSGNAFDPTTGEQWEAGVKYQPLGWNGLITASVFQITQQNVTTNDPQNVGFMVQEGEVRSRGFELEGKADLTNALTLIAGYSYTDARVTADNPDSSGISKIGTRVASVPYHQASFWLDYAFQQEALSGLRMGAGVRHVGSSMAPVDGVTGSQVKVSGYTLLDASVSYDFGARRPELQGLTLAVSGTNLTDERYFTPGFYSDTVFYGNRRTVNATLKYRW